MKSHQIKSLSLAAACLAIALAVSACSGGKTNSASESPLPSASPSETVGGTPTSESPSAEPGPADAVITGEGEYTGMMDGHSIEIIVEGQPTPFQIGLEIAEQVSEWDMGTPVKFEYTEQLIDAGEEQLVQMTIIKIEKI